MKRILFVDDDADLLQGLRARLHRRRCEWHMSFVDSGAAAISEMEKERADLIVSDVRMPGMDGGQLLSTVRARWPGTVRIVMSGYSEPAQLLQLVSVAHQYVSKPCDPQQLENVIERCLKLDALLRQEQLRAVVGRIGKLPAMPKTYQKLEAALSEPNTSAKQVADIVASDAVIAAKVLQVANSAFFRLARPMTRIHDAVAYLGFSSIRNLVMSAEVFSQWSKLSGPPGLEAERLQAHAQRTAAACVALTRKTRLEDDALLAGLVHDIGYWVLIQECPADLNRALQLAQSEGLASEEAERRVIGATHAEIGAYLLGLWGLPYPVIEAVAFHHSPAQVPQRHFDVLAVLAISHSLLPADNESSIVASSEMTPIVDSSYLEQVKPPFDWQEAQRRINETETQSELWSKKNYPKSCA
jgi:HD-like signal output (HDOD) protein